MERRNFIKKVGVTAFLSGMAGNIITGQAFAKKVNKSKRWILLERAADQGMIDFPKMDFDWGEGVMLEGMVYAYKQIGKKAYLDYLKEFGDRWHKQGITEVLNTRGYCGRWDCGYAMLMLYEITGDEKYLELAKEVIDFIENKALRTSEGALSHAFELPGLWVDTLYMIVPLCSNYSRLTGNEKCQNESVKQLKIFTNHLQDEKTGMFYHVWWEKTNTRTNDFWARGNGWVAMSLIEAIQHENKGMANYNELARVYQKQIKGILPLINEKEGLFHTVLDDTDSYVETSATAMIISSVLRAKKLGIVGNEVDKTLKIAWKGLSRQLDDKGSVTQVSFGTGPNSYHTVKWGTRTWGTGAYLRVMYDYLNTI